MKHKKTIYGTLAFLSFAWLYITACRLDADTIAFGAAVVQVLAATIGMWTFGSLAQRRSRRRAGTHATASMKKIKIASSIPRSEPKVKGGIKNV